MTFRAYRVTDFGEVELPDHETAQCNLDFTKTWLLIINERQAPQIVNIPNDQSDQSRPAAR